MRARELTIKQKRYAKSVLLPRYTLDEVFLILVNYEPLPKWLANELRNKNAVQMETS